MGIQTISKQVGFNQHADYEFSSALKTSWRNVLEIDFYHFFEAIAKDNFPTI